MVKIPSSDKVRDRLGTDIWTTLRLVLFMDMRDCGLEGVRHVCKRSSAPRFLRQPPRGHLSVPDALRFRDGTAASSARGRPDDMVEDVSPDGSRLALLSSKWITVRGAHRNRISFLQDGASIRETDRFLSWWCRFDPTGSYALVSTYNIKRRPVIVEVETGEFSHPIARDVDARYGDIDPLDGRLWACDERAKDTILSVDCRTGELRKIKIRLGSQVATLRFSVDGNLLFIVGRNGTLICCDRHGSTLWSQTVSEHGEVRGTNIFLNESGSHLCLPILETKRSEWGEDLIVSTGSGRIERSIIRHRGPPARLDANWIGDCALTYAGEIVDFFSGEVVSKLALPVKFATDIT